MSDNNKNINKDINKEFSGYTRMPASDNWLKLEKKLNRFNFLSFGWYHFNIYYCCLILAGLTLSGLYIYKAYSKDIPESVIPQTEIYEKNDLHVIDSLDTEPDSTIITIESDQKIVGSVAKERKNKKKTVVTCQKTDTISNPELINTADSLKKEDVPDTARKQIIVKNKKKIKKVIVVKENEKEVIDTVIKKKKNRLFNRK